MHIACFFKEKAIRKMYTSSKHRQLSDIGGNACDKLYSVKYVITKGISIKTKFSAFTLLGNWSFLFNSIHNCSSLFHLCLDFAVRRSENSQVKQMPHVVLIIIDSSVHVHMNNSPPKQVNISPWL